MLRYTLFGLVLVLTLLFSSCSDDSSTNPNDINDSRFPLQVGNKWEYKGTSYSWAEDALEDTIKTVSTGSWEITGIENIAGIDAYRMEVQTTYIEGPDAELTGTRVNWYTVVDDTLKWIAYSESEGGFDSSLQLYKPVEEYPVSESIADGWQTYLLIYPLTKGNAWVSNPKLSGIGGIFTVHDVEEITVPVGKLNAYKIRRNFDLNIINNSSQRSFIEELYVDSWYGTTGLIRREEFSKYREKSDDELSISKYYLNIMELTDYSLK